MGHVPKRLYSTASKLAISPSYVKQFPPKESLKTPARTTFDAEVWASLQPPPKSALSAFAHRIGLGSTLMSEKTIQQACVHQSFLSFHQKYYPKEPLPPSNEQLAIVGNSLMGLFASEYLHASYPHLPLRVLKAAVSAHVGPFTCASVAQEMGATPLLRWHRQVRSEYRIVLYIH
jgi:large subunit ribosomal protein L44